MQQSSDFPIQSSASMFLITDPVLVLNLCAGMEHLVKELSLLLKLLENESVSSATAEKMSVVRNMVKQLQPSGEIEQQIHNSWAETLGQGPAEEIHSLIIIATSSISDSSNSEQNA